MNELLQALCAAHGASGCEDAVRAEILRRIEGYCTAEVDAVGNIIARKQGAQRAGRRVLLSSHMDEIGLIVTSIEENGLLRFSAMGEIPAGVPVGKRLLVGNAGVPGVIGIKPIHLCKSEERGTVPEADELTIDIGASNAQEAASVVCVGECAVFDSPLRLFGSGCICGHALDDRVGCALLIELIRSPLPADCTFTFTVQGNTGAVGAATSAYSVQPDIAISVGTVCASDLPGVDAGKVSCRLGEGPVLSFKDRGTVYENSLYRSAWDTAREKNIPCQTETSLTGTTDARAIQTAGPGVKMLAVSVPCRYQHSPSCLVRLKDMEESLHLLSALIGRFAR